MKMLTRPIETAVILAATDGMRMRPLTAYIPKVLLPIGEKPILVRHLERLEDVGIKHVIITLEPRLGGMIQKAIEGNYQGQSTITFLFQNERRGMGYGLLLCRDYLGTRPFVFLLGDEYAPSGRIFKLLKVGEYLDLDGCISVRSGSLESVCATAAVTLDPVNGTVRGYIEKPSPTQVTGNICTAGVYLFRSEYLDALASLESDVSSYVNGEFSIGAAIQLLIRQGFRIGYIEETEDHIHFTSLEDFWRSNGIQR